MKAFYVLDVDHTDRITIDDNMHTYNAKQHPDVIQGKKTEDEILYDFLETFDTHHANSKDDIKDANADSRRSFGDSWSRSASRSG